MPAWLNILLGLIILALALREIFLDLFHPSSAGVFSLWVGRTLFGLGHNSPMALTAAGPLALVLVIASWAWMVAIGFALLYAPFLRSSFDIKDTVPLGPTYVTALYFSLECLTTVGLGDILPKAGWLRLAGATEGLLGISLVTASITWIVLLYPALARLRALARHTAILEKAQRETRNPVTEPMLSDLAAGAIATRVDFIHYPLIYFFRAGEEEASLPRALPVLMEFARENEASLSGTVLRCAVEELAQVLRAQFLPRAPEAVDEIFKAFAEAHKEGARY